MEHRLRKHQKFNWDTNASDSGAGKGSTPDKGRKRHEKRKDMKKKKRKKKSRKKKENMIAGVTL